jgi:hypothetical protein
LELGRLDSIRLQGAIDGLICDQNEMLDEISELKGGDKRDLDGMARFEKSIRKRASKKKAKSEKA